MKTFFRNIFWDIPVDLLDGFSFMGIFLTLAYVAVIGIVSFLLATGLFWVADSTFLDYKPGHAIIVSKTFDPAHDETHTQTQMIGESHRF